MTLTEDSPDGRSQDLTCAEADGKIIIDISIVKKLSLLVDQCLCNLESSRDSDIFLTSLNSYLSESSDLEQSRKSLLLLSMYCDVVPQWLKEVESWLIDVAEQITLIVAAIDPNVVFVADDDNE
jgi:hypothetical protein